MQTLAARAAAIGARARLGAERLEKSAPPALSALLVNRPRAARIIEREDRRLGDRVGSPEACWVAWVALDLGRPPFVALDDDAEPEPFVGQRRGVVRGDQG